MMRLRSRSVSACTSHYHLRLLWAPHVATTARYADHKLPTAPCSRFGSLMPQRVHWTIRWWNGGIHSSFRLAKLIVGSLHRWPDHLPKVEISLPLLFQKKLPRDFCLTKTGLAGECPPGTAGEQLCITTIALCWTSSWLPIASTSLMPSLERTR